MPPEGEKGMRLDSLELTNFRNYGHLLLENLGSTTIFVGPNAVGKTNIIEAVQLMTALKSFRSSKADQMVLWNRDKAVVRTTTTGERHIEEKLEIEDGKKRYFLNGKPRRIQDLKGILPAVSFSPDDLSLAKGSSRGRLSSIDDLGSQLSSNFHSIRRDYSKILRQKNAALKEEAPDAFLDSLDEVLVKVGIQYLSHRIIVINKMRSLFQHYYQGISESKKDIGIAFIPSWDKYREEELLEQGVFDTDVAFDKETYTARFFDAQKSFRAQERNRTTSVVGPHADHLFFLLEGRNAMHFASQGEQRSLVLAFKLAETSIIQQMLNQKPILLLDDVMSELDEHRRRYFMEFVARDLQTFITTTTVNYFEQDLLDAAHVYELPFESWCYD